MGFSPKARFQTKGLYPLSDNETIRPFEGRHQGSGEISRRRRRSGGHSWQFGKNSRGKGASGRRRACRPSQARRRPRASGRPQAFPAPRRQIIAEKQNSCDPVRMLQSSQDGRRSPHLGARMAAAGGSFSPRRSRPAVFFRNSRASHWNLTIHGWIRGEISAPNGC